MDHCLQICKDTGTECNHLACFCVQIHCIVYIVANFMYRFMSFCVIIIFLVQCTFFFLFVFLLHYMYIVVDSLS